MKRSLMAVLCMTLILPSTSAFAQAPPATPLHLAVTKPLTPVTDVLASLSQQSGVPILADDTVVDTLSVTNIDTPTVPAMLDAITALLPAITWQRVELPSDAPLPTANALSAQMRDLKALAASHLTVIDPAAHTTLIFSRATDSPATAVQSPSSTTERTIYLVTNETVRAQREATAKSKAAATQTTTPLNQTVGGMQNVADAFGQLTPDQQRAALPQMAQQFQQIMRSLDPGVIQDLRQQAMQNGGMPFGGNMGGGQRSR